MDCHFAINYGFFLPYLIRLSPWPVMPGVTVEVLLLNRPCYGALTQREARHSTTPTTLHTKVYSAHRTVMCIVCIVRCMSGSRARILLGSSTDQESVIEVQYTCVSSRHSRKCVTLLKLMMELKFFF